VINCDYLATENNKLIFLFHAIFHHWSISCKQCISSDLLRFAKLLNMLQIQKGLPLDSLLIITNNILSNVLYNLLIRLHFKNLALYFQMTLHSEHFCIVTI